MVSSLLAALAPTPALLAILGVAALMVSGATLIASGVRMSHEAIARRVDLVIPRATAAAAPKKKKTRSLEKRELSLRQQGVPEREQREIIRRLSRLGIPAVYAPSYFTAGRVLAAAGLGLLMLIAASHIAAIAGFGLALLLAALIGAVVGWLLPPMFIRMSAKGRARAVAGALPEALDLLVVCVDAGLSLEDALARVVVELEQSRPALADELALTSADLQILPSRDEALMRMADRVDMPSVRSVVTTLAQTLRYGTPLAQALRVIAAEMRDDALIQLEERANQLPALLTVPMMLFIMPTIFLIVGGPAAIKLLDILGR
jgi:tight adherence protein C